MQKKIILVGCGNIGSRHLQAIVKLPDKPIINIVEPNENAQNIGKDRIKEKMQSLTINWYCEIEQVKEIADKCFIYLRSSDCKLGPSKPLALEVKWKFEEFGLEEPNEDKVIQQQRVTISEACIECDGDVIWRQSYGRELWTGDQFILHLENVTIEGCKIKDLYESMEDD